MQGPALIMCVQAQTHWEAFILYLPMMLLMTGGCWEMKTFSPLPLYSIPGNEMDKALKESVCV